MSPARMQQVESATRLALDLVACYNSRDWQGLRGLCVPGVSVETPSPAPSGTLVIGIDAVVAWAQDLVGQRPQSRLTIEEVMSFGQRGVAKFRVEGSQRGVMLLQTRGGLLSELAVYTKA